MDRTDGLASLRDLHMPPAPEAGAAGPALVALALFSLAMFMLIAWRVWQRWHGWRGATISAIGRIDTSDAPVALAEMASILRRAALGRRGGGPAGLTGDDWLRHLDALFATRFFTTGDGRAFGDALYRPTSPDLDAANLRDRLVKALRRGAMRPW
jgi:hypothetical protein